MAGTLHGAAPGIKKLPAREGGGGGGFLGAAGASSGMAEGEDWGATVAPFASRSHHRQPRHASHEGPARDFVPGVQEGATRWYAGRLGLDAQVESWGLRLTGVYMMATDEQSSASRDRASEDETNSEFYVQVLYALGRRGNTSAGGGVLRHVRTGRR
jgi:hypothetical protein